MYFKKAAVTKINTCCVRKFMSPLTNLQSQNDYKLLCTKSLPLVTHEKKKSNAVAKLKSHPNCFSSLKFFAPTELHKRLGLTGI